MEPSQTIAVSWSVSRVHPEGLEISAMCLERLVNRFHGHWKDSGSHETKFSSGFEAHRDRGRFRGQI